MEMIIQLYERAILFISENWEGMVASILSAILLAAVGWLFTWFFASIRSRKYKAVLGEFHMYGFDTSGKGDVVHGIMNIYKRLGKIRASENNDPFYYRGTVSLTGKNIFITMEGKEHGEHLNYVFNEPLMKNINKLWGVRSCISVTRVPCVALCLLSKAELTDEHVRDEFRREFGNINKTLLFAPHESIYEDNYLGKTPSWFEKLVSVFKKANKSNSTDGKKRRR